MKINEIKRLQLGRIYTGEIISAVITDSKITKINVKYVRATNKVESFTVIYNDGKTRHYSKVPTKYENLVEQIVK